ncbi:hypothetical protein [Endozoicomonas sp. SCSIO W0465]|uniref:hypothetical protein n=1 Tax=Endozoicomonas sp. SCSIO W0465 TaxID=2918516 RepID=UPI0020759508|nr:hypothetical protein [Endozoicomonas sp. SCSIO W0465]USE37664.1 hypothetical protein MJO57_05510 [Endozoicomonas sp. SCSIO W0465]
MVLRRIQWYQYDWNTAWMVCWLGYSNMVELGAFDNPIYQFETVTQDIPLMQMFVHDLMDVPGFFHELIIDIIQAVLDKMF